MNLTVVSYSLTGNNRALAENVARKLNAKHIAVTDQRAKKRTMGTAVKELLLGLTPKVQPAPDMLQNGGTVILVGPVWIGSVATPLRAYMKRLKKLSCPYAFLSISGGADGPNPKLASELTKRIGRAPAAVIDQHIADLLPRESKPTRDETSTYKLTEADTETLAAQAVRRLKGLTGEE